MKMAALVFTSGTWVAEQLREANPTMSAKIRSFIPGRLDLEPSGGTERGAITTFGRLSLGDDKKQASSVLSAYKILVSAWQRDQLDEKELPSLRMLGVNCDTATQQDIKKDVFESSGWDARVEFLTFRHDYEFESSATLSLVSDSRMIVTPAIVESFGLTSLEAISLGIPLIAGRRSGFAYELKRLITDIPESAIEWLEVSDFDDLPTSLSQSMRRILRNPQTHNRNARVLAQHIVAEWPTWESSCSQWCVDVANARLE